MSQTRTQAITSAIREMIVNGALVPGSRVEEKPMADCLGVSRTPIRDSLAILASEGYLEYFPNRGYVVKVFGNKEILDAFLVRAEIEGLACRTLAESRPGPHVIQKLQDIVNRADEVVLAPGQTSHHRAQWHALNLEFHFALVDATENRHLSHFVRYLRRFPLIFDNRRSIRQGTDLESLYPVEHSIAANKEHRKIVRLIAAGEAMRADNMMQEHIRENRDILWHVFSDAANTEEQPPAPARRRRRRRTPQAAQENPLQTQPSNGTASVDATQDSEATPFVPPEHVTN